MLNIIGKSRDFMSKLVHTAYSVQSTKKFQDKINNLPDSWSLVCSSKGSFISDYQYRAAAFVNHETKELVIANAGTNALNLWDLYDDLGLIRGAVPSKMSSIKSLLDNVQEKFLNESLDISEYTISSTGHSLGAILSDLAIVEAQSRGLKVKESITLENPGSLPIINSAKESGLFCNNENIDITKIKFNVTDARPNPINTTNLNVQNAELNMVLPEIQNKTDKNIGSSFFSFLNPIARAKNIIQYTKQILSEHGLGNFLESENKPIVKVDSLPDKNYNKTILSYDPKLMEKAKNINSDHGNYVMHKIDEVKISSIDGNGNNDYNEFLNISNVNLTDSILYNHCYNSEVTTLGDSEHHICVNEFLNVSQNDII